ncbi:hypothetical protein D623_10028528 [Myotis brandtii]|uniref:Uncharacterized protein n=1 Tax=Myotis brandtii TaxID=109478 RepID=S7P8F2_MYOBR|nr:hypothetical protein D623_10028528 [Myotis brandtii]
MLRASPCARRLRASQSGVFGPAACPIAKTPILPDRLIIDKRKTLPRKLVSNRAAPATPHRAAPLPSPFAPRSQLPTGCLWLSALGARAGPGRNAALRLPHSKIRFPAARSTPPGSAPQVQDLGEAGEAGF